MVTMYEVIVEDILRRFFTLQTTGLPHELIGSVQQIAEVFRR